GCWRSRGRVRPAWACPRWCARSEHSGLPAPAWLYWGRAWPTVVSRMVRRAHSLPRVRPSVDPWLVKLLDGRGRTFFRISGFIEFSSGRTCEEWLFASLLAVLPRRVGPQRAEDCGLDAHVEKTAARNTPVAA